MSNNLKYALFTAAGILGVIFFYGMIVVYH